MGKVSYLVLIHPKLVIRFCRYRLKASGEQVDDRIVEVFWDTKEKRWRLMRFRDDKPAGNHKSVVDKIIQSIIDGVEKEDVSLIRGSDFHDRSTHFSDYLTAPGT